jgi:hypothetical protein
LWVLLAICIVRFWIVPLPSSFWVDEAGTLFVVRQGAHHPSLAIAPQVPASIYFWLPRVSERALPWLPQNPGVTEAAYRLPSVLAMLAALLLIARIAMRLIHPDAGWFAVFACFGLRGLNYAADDARPYALGMLMVSGAVLFLIRWLDRGRVIDAAVFLVFAALIWRVHLIYWPFYVVLFLYTVVRLARAETPVGWPAGAIVWAILGLSLIPVAVEAFSLFRQAGAHVITALPGPGELVRTLKFGLILWSAAIALVLRFRGGASGLRRLPATSVVLVVAWWLIPPAALFAYSWGTGNSVFVNRYMSFGLPGIALCGTLAAAFLVPQPRWRWAAVILGAGVLIFLGDWRHQWPPHHGSDWRGAAAAVNALPYGPDLPVLCPSPFIEARAPEWSPRYPLPGFLYAHLATYPVRGRLELFPFQTSPEAEAWASQIGKDALQPFGRFVLYGSSASVQFWSDWYLKQPEFEGWRAHRLGDFGDVAAVMCSAPDKIYWRLSSAF